ncbi:MAG: hypothetical protein PUB34_08170 [Clostridia bacterium]|nr:hypothetical protein [Clostridia bacterium]
MKNKERLICSLLAVIILMSTLVYTAFASDIMPLWDNTYSVSITHGLVDGKACCNVEIIGYTGTSKIDNVTITLYKKVGNALILIEEWENLSATGSKFRFYDEVDGVASGYTYRLTVTADVHRNGTVENIDTYGDSAY